MAGADQLKDTIAQLATAGQRPRRGKNPIPSAKAAGASISVSTGTGSGAQPSTSGGLDSPLTVTEMSGTSAMTMVSTDGFFVLNLPEQVNMRDASGRTIKVKFPT